MLIRKHYLMIFLLPAVFLTSCDRYEYWDISRFNIQPDALEDGEEIKLLYASRGPDDNTDQEYYYHFVVESQKTGDTVNILTVSNTYLEGDVKYEIFNYLSADSDVGKMSRLSPEQMKDLDNVNALDSMEFKEITKIARDPKFDHIADNDYPTVFGTIGKVFPTDSVDVDSLIDEYLK